MEIKYWIVCGICAVLAYFFKWIIGIIADKVLAKFDDVIVEIKGIRESIILHSERLKYGDEKLDRHENMLNDHEKRIKDIEIGGDK